MLQTPSTPLASSLADARMAEMLSNWKLTPATMFHRLDPTWIPAKWLQYLSLKIAQAIARGNCGLLISAPPRHGKSMLSTIATPLWCLENFPQKNVVIATYGEDLSTDFSRQVRDHIQNNQDILNVRLRTDTQRVTNFLTTQGGGLKAVGLRGAITGRGAHVFVLDDYIKEPKEAMSAQYLEDLWTWYLTVARTRLEPGAVVIILATRWVPNDIHGRIMDMQAKTGRNFFEYIEMPAIAWDPSEKGYKPDLIGREPGEVLFPERYNRESIYDIKLELGSRWFNAMFQQQPDSDENRAANPAWFKRLDRIDFQKRVVEARNRGVDNVRVGRSWDFASLKEAGDFTCGMRGYYFRDTGEFFLEHQIRGQYSPARAEAEFQLAVASDYALDERIKIGMEQEPGSSGAYSVRHFERLAREARPGARVFEQRATTSKLLNAQPLLAAAEANKVYLVTNDSGLRDWHQDFWNEVETFPEGANDDQIDAAANCYKMLSGKTVKATFGRGSDGKDLPGPAVLGQNVSKKRSSITFGRSFGL